MPGAVTITILGPATSEKAIAMRERVRAAIQRDLGTAGAAAVLLTYLAATDSYRIETATEHLVVRNAGTARLRNRVEDVRKILLTCGAKVADGH